MRYVVLPVLLLATTIWCEAQPLRECLVLPMPGGMSRSIVYTDPIQALQISGAWTPPKAGDTVTFPDGSTQQWQAVTASADGWFEHPALRNGYAYAVVSSDREKVVLLDAQGNVSVTVNGETRVGDVYQHGYVKIPVLLKQGQNELLFRCSRAGKLLVRLSSVPADGVLLTVGDATLPDLVVGEDTDVWLGVVVINASTQTQRGLTIAASHEGGRTVESAVPGAAASWRVQSARASAWHGTPCGGCAQGGTASATSGRQTEVYCPHCGTHPAHPANRTNRRSARSSAR
jgi:hypothetical protein